MKIHKLLFFCAAVSLGLFSCSDLDEELKDAISQDISDSNVDTGPLLAGAYNSLRLPFQDQSRFWAAQQHTSDETLGPTRGPDWDDNGIWRVLHQHTWDADHAFLNSTFQELLQSAFSAGNILTFNPDPQTAAEARFIRAFTMFCVADGWGQVPFREPGSSLDDDPQVFSATQTADFVIDELNAIIADLPDGPTNRANKDAARVLLMKTHLNKGVWANREAPSFDQADMNEVIAQSEAMGGTYSLATNFFDNFAPNNDAISTENIWTGENVGGSSSGNVRSRWYCTMHYAQNPSGWNGFTTLSDFYDKFEADDARIGTDYPGVTDVGGVRAGFLVGQQFDGDGNALEDRLGNPLAFTPEVAPTESGGNLEVTGIRVVKYPIDYNGGDNADNDYVFFRYADVLLMRAEAMLRSGRDAEALSIVNEIRTARNASTLSSLSLDELLDERGRELYWEGWRRQDLIRFGKFLEPWQGKSASGSERLLFAIPAAQVAVNPNLEQNPGY